jgi:hypothetical protein
MSKILDTESHSFYNFVLTPENPYFERNCSQHCLERVVKQILKANSAYFGDLNAI